MNRSKQSYRAMETLALEVLHERKLLTPPINVYAALHAHGIEVDLISFSNYSLSGAYMDEPGVGPSVALNEQHDFRKRRFTAAHELKHHLADRTPGGSQLECLEAGAAKSRVIERAANAFAARFLVPAEMLKGSINELGETRSIYALAELFGVNYPVIVYQLHNSGLINAAQRNRLMSPMGQIDDGKVWHQIQKNPNALKLSKRFGYLARRLKDRSSAEAYCDLCGALAHEDGPCWQCGEAATYAP